MKKYKLELIISSIAIVCFALVAIFIFAIGANKFDTFVYDAVISLKSDFCTGFFNFITFFGGTIFTIILAVISLTLLINKNQNNYRKYVKNKKFNNIINMFMPWIIFVGAILLITVLFLVFKEIFARTRPIEWFIIEEDGWSFPSGHTATSVAMFGTLCLLINRSVCVRWVRVVNILLTSLLVALIAISRIYLGVHFATDILGGACLGVLVVCIASIFAKAFDAKICYKSKESENTKHSGGNINH